jgi:ornithine--oxo-acid transaminase
LMIGIEFGPPKSLSLKPGWHMMEAANKGLFCQLITIPLFKEHHVLSQVAGHGMQVVKFLPPLIVNEDDCKWIAKSLDQVIGESHSAGAFFSLGKTLAGHALKARSSAA